MVSKPRKLTMAWMEMNYLKHTHFRWKTKWRLEQLVPLGIMSETAPALRRVTRTNKITRRHTCRTIVPTYRTTKAPATTMTPNAKAARKTPSQRLMLSVWVPVLLLVIKLPVSRPRVTERNNVLWGHHFKGIQMIKVVVPFCQNRSSCFLFAYVFAKNWKFFMPRIVSVLVNIDEICVRFTGPLIMYQRITKSIVYVPVLSTLSLPKTNLTKPGKFLNPEPSNEI